MIFTLHNGNSYVIDRFLFDVSAIFGEDFINPFGFLFGVIICFLFLLVLHLIGHLK